MSDSISTSQGSLPILPQRTPPPTDHPPLQQRGELESGGPREDTPERSQELNGFFNRALSDIDALRFSSALKPGESSLRDSIDSLRKGRVTPVEFRDGVGADGAVKAFHAGEITVKELMSILGGREEAWNYVQKKHPETFEKFVRATYAGDYEDYRKMEERDSQRQLEERNNEYRAEALDRQGKTDEANKVRGDFAIKRLDEDAQGQTPRSRAMKAIDAATAQLDKGDGVAAAQIYEHEAGKAREAASRLPSGSQEAKTLLQLADHFEGRMKCYRAGSPRESYEAASRLNGLARNTEMEAQQLEQAGNSDDARLLRAVASDSKTQSYLVAESAQNTNVLLGHAVSKTYQDIVDKSFQNKISEYGSIRNFFTGKKEKLETDRKKMSAVFDEINGIMKNEGISFDRAWNRMFEDNRVLLDNGALRGAGFVTRNDAATFLRDHEVTRDLLSPFADLSRGLSEGDGAGVDRAQGQIVEVLRKNGQWNIAHQVLEEYKRSAKSSDGQADAQRLADNERGQWWKAKAGEFLEEDLPVLLLSGIVSGGLGSVAKGGAMALGWGARAARATQIATELGAFVPVERVLGDVMNGKQGDWSPGALGRDYALTIGGYGLFKALGKAWSHLRSRVPSGATGEATGRAAGEATGRTAGEAAGATLSNEIVTGVEGLPRAITSDVGHAIGKHGVKTPEEIAELTSKMASSGEKAVTWFKDNAAIQEALKISHEEIKRVLARDPEKLKQFEAFLKTASDAKGNSFGCVIELPTPVGEGLVRDAAGLPVRVSNISKVYIQFNKRKVAGGAYEIYIKTLYPRAL